MGRYPYLKKLTASMCGITDLSILTPLKELEELRLSYNQISDLSPISSLKKLKMLDIGVNPVSDITPLLELPLEKLRIDNTTFLDNKKACIDAIKNHNLPKLHKGLEKYPIKNDLYIKCNRHLHYGLLHIAIQYDNIEAFLLMLEKGADISRKDYTGNTPLDIATAKQRSVLIQEIAKRQQQNSTLNLLQ